MSKKDYFVKEEGKKGRKGNKKASAVEAS